MTGLIIQGLINGLILGAIYGLIGVGLNVIFGVLRVVNFAHGEFLVLGAYFAFYLMEYAGINRWWRCRWPSPRSSWRAICFISY